MAKTHGKETAVLINEFDVSGFFNSMDLSRDVDTPESTTFGDDDREYIAGLRGGSISYGGFWDNTSTTGSDEVLNATLGVATARIVSAYPAGTTLGNIAYLYNTHSTSYSVSSPVDGITSISADMIATGQIERGVSVHALTARTSTANGTSVDSGASSSNGGVGHLHVTALSGATTLDVDIEDSANDSTFASLISFTQVTTSTTSERSTVAGTVDRYLRAAWTISGTSYTFAVTFARR